MNIRSTLSRVVALALLAAPAAVLAGPAGDAQAATAKLGTLVTLQLSDSKPVEYGKSTSLYGAVKDSTGSSVDNGTVELLALPYGSSTWTAIASQPASGYVSFDVKPTIGTAYQLRYDGYTATNSYENTYTPNQSTPVAQQVARKLKISHHALHMSGKVTPAAKLKIAFKTIHGKKLKKWFTVKTNKKGKFSKQIPPFHGRKFAVIVPASGGYAGALDAYTIL